MIPTGLRVVELLREPSPARPFRTLSTGAVADRFSGEATEITLADLEEMVRVFRARRGVDHVPLDWNHQTSPFADVGPQTPDTSGALGEVADLFVLDEGDGRGPGLYVRPAYTARGREVVEAHRLEGEDGRSTLWSSPEFVVGLDVYGRDGAGVIGTAQLLAVALTPRPAQTTDRLDAVRLTETKGQTMQQETEQVEPAEPEVVTSAEGEEVGPSVEELEAENAALREQILALEAELEGMRSEMEATDITEADRLAERLEVVEAALYGEKKARALDALVASGRIAPAERGTAERAYDAEQRHGVTLYTELYAGRTEGAAVPLEEVGHAATPPPPVSTGNPLEDRRRAVVAWCESAGINYHADPVAALKSWQAAKQEA